MHVVVTIKIIHKKEFKKKTNNNREKYTPRVARFKFTDEAATCSPCKGKINRKKLHNNIYS